MSDAVIMAQVRELLFKHASKLLNYDFLMIALIGITYQTLGSLLHRYYGEDSEQVRAKLISGVTGNVTMETNKRIWSLAQEAKHSPTVRGIIETSAADPSIQVPLPFGEGNKEEADIRAALEKDGDGRIFLAEFDAFLQQYGHREVRMDILYPTWREDPTPVLQFIRGYFDADEKASPFAQQERLVRERGQLAREVDEHVQQDLAGRVAIAPLFHWVLHNTQEHTRERDTMHFELTRLFPPFRRALLELGGRWQKQGLVEDKEDIFFLTVEEMEDVSEMPRPVQEIVRERRAEFEYQHSQSCSADLAQRRCDASLAGSKQRRRGTAAGIAGSPGVAEGVVRVIRGPQDFQRLARGEILVAPLTNPVWTPLFAIAGGIITQVGGIYRTAPSSRVSTGIPAVMAVQDATTLLQDGQWVKVDGNKGIVTFADKK